MLLINFKKFKTQNIMSVVWCFCWIDSWIC